jgi:DNA replication and repair protein RecF
MKILQNTYNSNLDTNDWLDSIELNIFNTASHILKIRKAFLQKFIQTPLRMNNIIFPHIMLSLECEIQDYYNITNLNNENLKEYYLKAIKHSRKQDIVSKKTLFGVHRAKWFVMNTNKNIDSRFCSTGEQKLMFMSIIFHIADLYGEFYETPLILLLDDIVAHLDNKRKDMLFTMLCDLNVQSFLTGTQKEHFLSISNIAQNIAL